MQKNSAEPTSKLSDNAGSNMKMSLESPLKPSNFYSGLCKTAPREVEPLSSDLNWHSGNTVKQVYMKSSSKPLKSDRRTSLKSP